MKGEPRNRQRFFVHIVLCTIGALMLVVGAYFFPVALADEKINTEVDYESLYPVPAELHQPIEQALRESSIVLPTTRLTVSSVNQYGDWLYVILLPTSVVDSNWDEPLYDSDVVDILAKRENEQWVAYVKGTEGFGQLAMEAPPEWIDFSESQQLESAELISPVVYRLPWTEGQEWKVTKRWHENYGGKDPREISIDFAPIARSNPPVDMAVLAAADGVMSIVCGGNGSTDTAQARIRIAHRDGTSTYYLHVDARTLRLDLVGKMVLQGQYLGTLYNPGYEWFRDCGHGSGPHLHFTFPFRETWIDGISANVIGNSSVNTRYRSSNPRIDNPYSTGKFAADVYISTTVLGDIDKPFFIKLPKDAKNDGGGYWAYQQWFTGDFNGDGKTDLAKLWNDGGSVSVDVHVSNAFLVLQEFEKQRWATKQGGFWDTQRWFTGDFNGDGKTDLAKLWNDGGAMTIDVHLSTGTGFVKERWATRQGGYWDAQKWLTGDFNGDGKTDLAKLWNEGGSMNADVHLSTGKSFNLFNWATQQGGYWDAQQWFTGDFNGDGKTDLAKLWNDGGAMTIDVHRSTGKSFAIERWATQQGGYWDAQRWLTGDFDGDKKTDFAKVWNEGGSMNADVHRSTGKSFDLFNWATQQGGYWDAQQWFTGDFNGDGKTDLAKRWNDGGGVSVDVHLSKGKTSAAMKRWATKLGGYSNTQKWFVADFNGDGKSDLVKSWQDNGQTTKSVGSSGGFLADVNILIELPDGWTRSNVTIAHETIEEESVVFPENMHNLGMVYDVVTDPMQDPIVIPYFATIQYDEFDLGNSNEDTIGLYFWTGVEWEREPTSQIDTENNIVTVSPTRLGRFVLLVKNPDQYFLPLVTSGRSD